MLKHHTYREILILYWDLSCIYLNIYLSPKIHWIFFTMNYWKLWQLSCTIITMATSRSNTNRQLYAGSTNQNSVSVSHFDCWIWTMAYNFWFKTHLLNLHQEIIWLYFLDSESTCIFNTKSVRTRWTIYI